MNKYETRKSAITEIGHKLFLNHGYDNTSVNDIILRAGIAKGTFYHYFSSKEELLDKDIEKLVRDGAEKIYSLADRNDLTVINKLNVIFTSLSVLKAESKEELFPVLRVLHINENLMMRYKLVEQTIELVSPILSAVIMQGIEEEVLDVVYVEESARLLIRIGTSFTEEIARLLITDMLKEEKMESINHKLQAYENVVNRVLNTEEEEVSIINSDFMSLFIK